MNSSQPNGNDFVFYDGGCALCHGYVRWILKRDRKKEFKFAPLHGDTFQKLLAGREASNLPDSIVALTRDGRLLIESAAALHIMTRLGGFWAGVAGLLRLVPRVIRDLGYRLIARIRYRVFGRTKEVCPLVPPELRERILG